MFTFSKEIGIVLEDSPDVTSMQDDAIQYFDGGHVGISSWAILNLFKYCYLRISNDMYDDVATCVVVAICPDVEHAWNRRYARICRLF